MPLRARGIRYEGGFYGQSGKGEPVPEAIAVESLIEDPATLPAGWTELGCHPGSAWATNRPMGRSARRRCETLCDPRVREAIAARESPCAPSPRAG